MNHKLAMYNLEKIKIEKLHAAKEIQKEIAKIEASMSEHRSLYLRNEKKSDQAREVLAGYGRDNVRSILKFLIGSLSNAEGYYEFYGDIDFSLLMDDNDFFDFVIVAIGGPTIKSLKKRFDRVEVVDGEEQIRVFTTAPSGENVKNRIWRKLTKKIITTEAKRLLKEKEDERSTTKRLPEKCN